MKYVIANWKMNPVSSAQAKTLIAATEKGTSSLSGTQVVVCPPFLHLETVGQALKNGALGAQDLFWELDGPYTGEISSLMLKKAGVKYVNIGHSERRVFAAEDDKQVGAKLGAALAGGLQPIVCVGGGPEAIKIKKNLAATKKLIYKQLLVLKGLTKKQRQQIFIAYEPQWAVGTGRVASVEHISEMLTHIKKKADLEKILYGGSVTSSNAARLAKIDGLDGFLVGGASLKPKEFAKIAKAASMAD